MEIVPVLYDAEVADLLQRADLPVADLEQPNSVTLFGARIDGVLIAVVGIEALGEHGMLRSLEVARSQRGAGLGEVLVAHAESWAWRHGIRELHLLTTTAQDYFARLGYEAVERGAAPVAVVRTAQFATLCPASSVLMRKRRPG